MITFNITIKLTKLEDVKLNKHIISQNSPSYGLKSLIITCCHTTNSPLGLSYTEHTVYNLHYKCNCFNFILNAFEHR